MKTMTLAYSLFFAAISFSVYAGEAAKGKEISVICAGCHGANGIGLSQEFPNLAGQKEAYLLKQLKAFKSGARKDPTMNAMVTALDDKDIEDLAAYYSSLNQYNNNGKPAKADMPKVAGNATVNEFPEATFVTMKKDGAIETFPQQQTWEGGENMLYDAITPDGKIVLSTSPTSDKLYAFDANSGKQLAIINVGKSPKGVKVSPDGKIAYVSNQGSANISVVDLEELAVLYTIKVAEGPHNARFTKDGKLAYITLQGGAGIGVIDVASRRMTKVIPVAGITGPHNIDLSKDEKTAFIRDFVHHVAVLDLASGKVIKIITVGNGHGGIDVTPDGHYAATAAIGDTFISVIDTKTLEVKNIEVGNGPHGIRASKDSQWLYVTLTKDNMIAVINMKTLSIEKTITVGAFPFWVAVQGNP
jgi:YVTN family beta-propeller protein